MTFDFFPAPLDQFQPNLAQSIIYCEGIFIDLKKHVLKSFYKSNTIFTSKWSYKIIWFILIHCASYNKALFNLLI